jgi:hypothetical protein
MDISYCKEQTKKQEDDASTKEVKEEEAVSAKASTYSLRY